MSTRSCCRSTKGLTTGEISAHFAEIYGASVSKETISRITDKVVEEMQEWVSRPLESTYAAIFIDAIVVKVRDGQVANRPFYAAIGVTLAGEKDILGLWAGTGGEGAKFWMVSLLAARPVLRARVEAGLDQEWSPQQISRRLVLDFPHDPTMRTSHETIYLSIFQARARALTPRLHRKLRTARPMRLLLIARQPQGRGRILDMTSIHDRPPHVEDRAYGGHWEGDLVMGRRPSAVATLVDRRSRYLRLVSLPAGIKAPAVGAALVQDLNQMPFWLRRSLTWDRGREMAEHVTLTKLTGCQVYFCDPRGPWQRGRNENTNRLLRQYLSKTGHLATFDQAALDAIADRINGRPRQVLGWRTPAEVLADGQPVVSASE